MNLGTSVHLTYAFQLAKKAANEKEVYRQYAYDIQNHLWYCSEQANRDPDRFKVRDIIEHRGISTTAEVGWLVSNIFVLFLFRIVG